MKHKNVFQLMEKWAPKNLAFDWDPIGLQVGLQNDETKNILVMLDVLENVVDEAIENDVNLIISHHPLIFNPLKNIDLSSWGWGTSRWPVRSRWASPVRACGPPGTRWTCARSSRTAGTRPTTSTSRPTPSPTPSPASSCAGPSATSR